MAIVVGLLHWARDQWEPTQRPKNDYTYHDADPCSASCFGPSCSDNMLLGALRTVREYNRLAASHINVFWTFNRGASVRLFDNWRLTYCASGTIVVLVIHHNNSVNDRALLASVLLAIVAFGRNVWRGLDAGHDGSVCLVVVFVVCLAVNFNFVRRSTEGEL
jgi:hypothetical protein